MQNAYMENLSHKLKESGKGVKHAINGINIDRVNKQIITKKMNELCLR